MMMSQLGRLILSSSSASADGQEARPDDAGGYGPLMDDIDRAIEESTVRSDQPKTSD